MRLHQTHYNNLASAKEIRRKLLLNGLSCGDTMAGRPCLLPKRDYVTPDNGFSNGPSRAGSTVRRIYHVQSTAATVWQALQDRCLVQRAARGRTEGDCGAC